MFWRGLLPENSQPRWFSSLVMSRRMRSSETRPPALIVLSTLIPSEGCQWIRLGTRRKMRRRKSAMPSNHLPRGVLCLTLCRRRSPELIDDNCGNRCRRRSDCVPFPTPGAPMRMTRAALRSRILRELYMIKGERKNERVRQQGRA